MFTELDFVFEEVETKSSGIYKKAVKGEGYGDLTEHYQNIFNEFDELLKDTKIFLSNSMLEKTIQDRLHKKAKGIINSVAGNLRNKKMAETEITNQENNSEQEVKILQQENHLEEGRIHLGHMPFVGMHHS